MTNTHKKTLVLKTSLASQHEVERIGLLLDSEPLIDNWNVDLEDCDKVLQIECYELTETEIVIMLQNADVDSEELLW